MRTTLTTAAAAVLLTTTVAAGTVAAGTVTAAPAAAAPAAVAPAAVASRPPSEPRVAVHFDLRAGQTPENFVVEPDGSLDVTFTGARQVAHVGLDGRTRVLATMPLPADGGVRTPLAGTATPTGIVRGADGSLYIGYAAGDAAVTGVWRLTPGGRLHRIAPLPADSFPNGLALDARSGQIYVADSVLATIWRVPVTGGTPTAWATGAALARTAFAGSNGLKVHRGAVWTTNTDAGTLVRIPILWDGGSGPAQVRASGLTGVDDFAFTGRGDQVLTALFGPNRVVLVRADGSSRTVLTAADGLQNPTAVAVRHRTVYVDGSGRLTGADPNVVLARLDPRRGR